MAVMLYWATFKKLSLNLWRLIAFKTTKNCCCLACLGHEYDLDLATHFRGTFLLPSWPEDPTFLERRVLIFQKKYNSQNQDWPFFIGNAKYEKLPRTRAFLRYMKHCFGHFYKSNNNCKTTPSKLWSWSCNQFAENEKDKKTSVKITLVNILKKLA